MRVLLFGKNGQLGWALQRALAPLGELIAVDADGVPPLPGDFLDVAALDTLIDAVAPQLIVNAAAHTAVDRAEAEPDLAFAVNAEAVGAIAGAAATRGAWLVHYSTDYVFDGSGSTPWSENAPTGPLSVYGRSKLEGEDRIRASGCRYLVLRTSWMYPARGGNFARTILHRARTGDTLSVIDDQIGAPTGVELLADVTAHACRTALARPELAGTYHVAAAGETSWYGYACHIIEAARALGEPIRVAAGAIRPIPGEAYPHTAKRPRNSRLDTTKFRAAFDLNLPSWQTGVDRMLTEMTGRRGSNRP